jgi:hypothetical protein
MRERQGELQSILQAIADLREATRIDRDHARIELRGELIHNRTIFLEGLDSIVQRLDRIELLMRQAIAGPGAEDAY